MGFTQGFSIRVSNCLGANDERGMEKSIAMSYLSCFFIALIAIVCAQIIIEPLLQLLNTPSHTIQGSYYIFKNYVRWCFNCYIL